MVKQKDLNFFTLLGRAWNRPKDMLFQLIGYFALFIALSSTADYLSQQEDSTFIISLIAILIYIAQPWFSLGLMKMSIKIIANKNKLFRFILIISLITFLTGNQCPLHIFRSLRHLFIHRYRAVYLLLPFLFQQHVFLNPPFAHQNLLHRKHPRPDLFLLQFWQSIHRACI